MNDSDSQTPETTAARPTPDVVPAEEIPKHCFIVMPFGRTTPEQRHFRGWFEVVIRPAVIEAGYVPVLAALEDRPNAINDEIRSHLAFDPMVLVDLGGMSSEDEPNPNVMYELGIRHAIDSPVVLMAWRGQRLPFDINNQRVIMEGRELVDLDTNRRRIVTFIHEAEQGHFYRPMEAVGRTARLNVASKRLGRDVVISTLIDEVRDLKATMNFRNHPSRIPAPRPIKYRDLVGGKTDRKQFHTEFLKLGGDEKTWGRVLHQVVPDADAPQVRKWKRDDWLAYFHAELYRHKPELLDSTPELPLEPNNIPLEPSNSTDTSSEPATTPLNDEPGNA